MGITVGDVNNDRYPDLYISNDFYERDYLYINQQDGTFTEEVESRMQQISLASMGADMADINNDGYPEVFVTEMLPETEYRKKTTVQFEDVNLFDLKQRRGFYKQFMHNTLQLNDGRGEFREGSPVRRRRGDGLELGAPYSLTSIMMVCGISTCVTGSTTA